MVKKNTPLQEFEIGKSFVHVKREDLCVPEGLNWPRFAKIRGLFAFLKKAKASGVEVVGYAQNPISMAGWGVAAVAKALDMKAVIFYHDYVKGLPRRLAYHREKWLALGAEDYLLGHTRDNIIFNAAKSILREKYGEKAVMLPLGLKFSETVLEVGMEAKISDLGRFKSIVVCVGSGIMAAGILRSLPKGARLYGIMVKHVEEKDLLAMKGEIIRYAGAGCMQPNLVLINSGYKYEQEAKCQCPFPCHPIYDLKAWEWLNKNVEKLEPPILFWNVGGDSK